MFAQEILRLAPALASGEPDAAAALYELTRKKYKPLLMRRMREAWEDTFHDLYAEALGRFRRGAIEDPEAYLNAMFSRASKRRAAEAWEQSRIEQTVLDEGEDSARARAIRDSHAERLTPENDLADRETWEIVRRSIRRIRVKRRRELARRIWLKGEDDETVMRQMRLDAGQFRNLKSKTKLELAEIFPRVRKWRRRAIGECACGSPATHRFAGETICGACLVSWARQHLKVTGPRPPKPCRLCGKPWNPLRHGRCEACYQRWKKNGFVDRPSTRRPNAGWCACGCGTRLKAWKRKRGYVYERGHGPKTVCGCGCGAEITKFDDRGRERRFFGRHGFVRAGKD